MLYEMELKVLNEAANVGLDRYLAAVTALDLAEIMELEAVKGQFKSLCEGCSDERDVLENDLNTLELEIRFEEENTKEKAVKAGRDLAVIVTTSN